MKILFLQRDYLSEVPEEVESDFGRAPQFVQPLEEVTPVEENEEVVLTVKVTGIPKPVVRWFANDKQIIPTSETIIQEDEEVVTLVIKKMKPEYIGPITCEAHNELGVISTNTVLDFPGNFFQPFNLKLRCSVYAFSKQKFYSKLFFFSALRGGNCGSTSFSLFRIPFSFLLL